MEKNTDYGGQPEILSLVHVEERPITVYYETHTKAPGDSRSWESSEKADNVWRLFIQILLR